MDFIDHTGHIFSLDDYLSYPIGYEFDEQPYTFWMNDEYSSSLSVDCMYILPIRPITNKQVTSIEIIAKDTNNFRLLSSTKINDLINEGNVFDGIELDFASNEALKYNSETPNDFKMNLKYVSERSWPKDTPGRPNDICLVQNLTSDIFFYRTESNEEIIVVDESKIYEHQEVAGGYSTLDKESLTLLLNGYNVDTEDLTLTDMLNELDALGLLLHNYYLIVGYNEDGSPKFLEDKFGKYVRLFKKSTTYSMLPFYVIGSTNEFGTWQTNILIHIKTADFEDIYCPITVGGTFVDEQEELKINAQNIGLSLPKDICRALYESSFWNESPDMSLWNQKVKEYLMNYMKLRAERGNFQSAIAALKWFGYGDRVKLSSLIQTDNQFISQYILNNFDIQFDVINEFKHFRNSTLVSLHIPGTIEDENAVPNMMDFTASFWGEGKPQIKNMFEETVESRYDERDIAFIRPLYDWAFNELALKLCALKYYYQKFFLPVHLYIHRASITHQCFSNDIKLLNVCRTLITEKPIFAINDNTTVVFPETDTAWISEQCRYVDENWIEDPQLQRPLIENKLMNIVDIAFFDIIDNCFTVQIKLVQRNYTEGKEQIFNCKLLAYQDDKIMKECNFSICSNKREYILNFVIYPKALNDKFDINFWLNRDYKIMMLCNGKWYEYSFKIAIPELDIEVGKLVYKYDYEICKQFAKFEDNLPIFNVSMYLPDLVSITNINFVNELCEFAKNNYVTHLKDKFVEEDLLSGKAYYYYYNDEGKKTLLSSTKHTLVKDGDEYILKDNQYVEKENGEFPDELVKKIGKGPIYSSVYKNLHSFIDLYSVQQYIPTNYHFLNKVHIFDLYIEEYDLNGNFTGGYEKVKYERDKAGEIEYSGYFRNLNEDGTVSVDRRIENGNSISYEKYKFYDNDSPFIKEMYMEFFNTENGEWNKPLYSMGDDYKWKITTEEQTLYDLYLMHDFDYWYVIMISKYPIASANADLDKINKVFRSGKYTFRHNRSDNKFLVNRMEFGSMNNVYHFNPNDIIVTRLNNFNSLAFKLRIGSRWNCYPLGIGSSVDSNFSSPTNIGIISIKQTDVAHSEGYYSIQANYSIDNFVNEFQSRKTRILISSSINSPTPIVKQHFVNDVNIPVKPDIPTETPTEGPTLAPIDYVSVESLGIFKTPTNYSSLDEYIIYVERYLHNQAAGIVVYDGISINEHFSDKNTYTYENWFKFSNDHAFNYNTLGFMELHFEKPEIRYAFGWNDIKCGTAKLDEFLLTWNDNWESRTNGDAIEKRVIIQAIGDAKHNTSKIYEIIFRQS